MWRKNKKILALVGILLLLDLFLIGKVYTGSAAAEFRNADVSAGNNSNTVQAANSKRAAVIKRKENDVGSEGEIYPGEQVGKVALTFDDGPSSVYTPQLLDGLAARGVTVTFFLTGKNAEEHPEIVKRIYEEGHLIGNHTYSHLQLSNSNRERFKEELVKTCDVISRITGEEVVYVRPPYGSWDKTLEKELNLFPVLWTIDPLDWCTDNASSVVQKVVSKVKENSVILLHDEYASSVTAALRIVDELQEKGYEFVTVEEILFD